MRTPILVLLLSLAACGPAAAQQRTQSETAPKQAETGPKQTGTGHPLKGPETGVRGPSNSAPDTGPHGQRDVTKDAEPGKPPSPEELKKTGKVPQTDHKTQ